jgi:nucleoside-diphosphate-sugar epimerase
VRALITGSTGFVGGALTRRLLADGVALRVLVHRDAKRSERTPDGAEVVPIGLGDPNPIADAAAECDVVFHCAGENSVRAAPRALSWINVAGTENVLQASRHAGVPRLVHLSCADVSLTGTDRLGWKEDAVMTDAPVGACLGTKLLADDLVRQANSDRFTTVCVRPAWLWGPGDRTNLPALCEEARTGGVRLFGGGTNILATAYVGNVVEALIAAARADRVGGKAFHIADAEFVTAREFFTLLCETLGLGQPRAGVYAVSYAVAWLRERRGGAGPWRVDVARRGRACLLDCGRAAQELGYTPRVSMVDGMQALARWARDAGGPDAIRGLARAPQTNADADAYARVAATYDASG